MNSPPTPSNELGGIRELLAKATPGPWQWVQGHCHDPEQWSLSPGVLMADERDGTPGGDEIDRANAELIALAPTLAAENLTLSTRIKKLEEALGEAFYTLIYIFETTDDQKTAGAAKETADKIDTALSSSGGGE